ncbi:MAG: ECF transporter S component [Promethearchaeota archaeon]
MEITTEEKEDIIIKEKEKESQAVWLERKSFRVALLGIFTALAVVLGYALVFIPNIELFTLMIFLAGFIMGKRDGAIVGLMSSFIFVFFNPYGVSPLPLFAYQLVHYALVGFLGGVICNFLNKKDFFKPEEDLYVFPVLIIFAITGAVITFTFDVISTFIGALVFYGTLESFWPTYIIGLPFTTIHLIGNTLGFIFILPALIQLIYKMLDIS